MDPRSPYLHQRRYAPHLPQSQPQTHPPHPHNNFHTNPDIYGPHDYSLPAGAPTLPLQPPPPPPAPLQFHFVPTQPQFNPQNSHFTYNPNHINYNHPRSHPDVPKFAQPPRVSHQKPFDDDLSRRLPDNMRETRADMRQPSRVLSDRWPPERPYSSANLNSDSYRRQLVNQPLSPVKIRHGLEGNSRFVEDHNTGMEIRQGEEFLLHRRDDNYLRRSQFGSTSDRSSRDFHTATNQMNHGSAHENLRGLPYDDRVSGNQRWLHDREVSRDVHDSFVDRGSRDVGSPERIQIVSGKREHYRGRESNAELERHTGKGSREGSYEYNRTPRKQPQKKSVLLRIQKPNYRNREEEWGHYYFDDSKSSSFRGRDQNLYLDRGTGQQVREGSPVELDVSFKSNSLVAKAVVTPAPSSAAVSDLDSTPRNGKLREVLVLNKDSLSSSLIKPSEQTVKLVSAISVANKNSSSDKGLKQPREEVTDSGIANPKDISSLPASCGSKVSLGKSEMESSTNGTESNKVGANVVSSNTSSLKVGKKKKIVKIVVKKVVKKCEEPVILDSPVHGLPASPKPVKDDAADSVCISDSQPFSNDVSVMPKNDKVEECAKTMASENGTSAGSGILCVPNIKSKRSRSTSPMASSSHEEINTNEKMINGNSVNYMHAISNTDKDNKLPKKTFSSGIDNVEDMDKQQCQNGVSLLLGNNKASGSSEVLLPSDGNAALGFSSLEKIKIHKGPSSSCNTVLGYGSDNDSINSREEVIYSENGTTDAGCKQLFIDQDGLAVEHGCLDEILNASCCVGNNNMVWQSDSRETTIQNVPIHAICTNEGVRAISGSDSGHTISGEINSSSHGTSIGKQSSPDGVFIPIQNVSLGGSLHCIISTGGSEEDKSNIKKTDKNVEMTEVDLSKSMVNDLYLEPVNMVCSDCWVDTTLRLSFKDSTVTEVTVSGDGSGDAGIKPCKDEVSVSPLGTSMDVSKAIVYPPKQKKLKLSGSQLKLSCAITSDVNEGPITSDISVSSPETLSNYGNGPTRSETEAAVSSIDPLSISDFPTLQKDVSALPANCSGGGCHDTAASIRNAFDDDDDIRRVHLSSTVEELSVRMAQSLHPSGLEGEQIADAATVFAGSSHQSNVIHVENADGEKMDVDGTEEQAIIDSGAGQCQFPSENQSLNSDERLLIMDVESESCHHVKNGLSSLSNYLSSSRDGNGVSATNEFLGLSDMDYLVLSLDVPKTSDSQLSVENVGGDDKILGKLAVQGGSFMSPATSGPLNTEFTLHSDDAEENARSFTGRTGSLPPLHSKDSTQTLNAMSGEIHGRKNQPSQVSRISSGCSSFALSASKKAASSAHISKRRTWHRTENSSASAMPRNKAVSFSVPTQRQLAKNVAKFQSTSYIRKGNSLVRKSTVVPVQSQGSHCLSSSIYWLNSLGTDEVKKNAGSENRTVIAEPPNFWRTSSVNASFQRPRTPPLPTVTETRHQATSCFGDCIISSSAEPLNNFADETLSDPVTCAESDDVQKSSEDGRKFSENHKVEIGQINNLDCHSEVNDENVNVVSSNVSSITYIKRKSNQLVATSNPLSLSINNAQGTPTIPSDGYYKRKKNQLIRTSQESRFKPTACVPDGSVNSDEHTLDKNTSSRSLTKRWLCKVVTKTRKPSKFSLVWTLRSVQLLNGNGDLFHRQKVLPHLFPWKRATYWKNFVPNSAANSISGSSSTISRKLLLLRKRDTVYTRSKQGFSLRKSKVLSVGGSSLKWSKSIEKQSKKANEEATLAVAEAERKKREERGALHHVPGTKNRNSSRGRIFRIGSVRYKMDSSRRTLQRISDDESSFPAAPRTEMDAKRSYFPRRLVIGKDEYVRIGNGNQLVRDPKKRTRILASEKVRWSLHTARSRLARKRKYCQFFTRFGKCNKDDGKCPYIHDSSKIAVCTKFLNGLCFNSDCKLTHKVIPERMPDCSYFLQGICTNKNCPYRHVHVNPNASTCEGFLRGYCADGNECRKKHSYVCPTYEATGSCPQGSKCKLHHPKHRSKGKKSKQSREKKNAQGRYFGSMHINVSESGTAVSEKHSMQDNSNTCFEGSIVDYISVDFNDEAGENINPADEQAFFSDSNSLDFEIVDLDELIKPIRLMNT